MIPIGDDNSGRATVPWVTYLLVVGNLAIFVFCWAASPSEQAAIYSAYSTIPSRILAEGPAAWYTLLTATFLHASWAHVLGNMLFLWIFGDNVEDAMGHLRFTLFYLLCGVVASASQVAVSVGSDVPIVGASGAIAAVMGAYLVMFPTAGVRTLLVILPPFFFVRLLPAWLLIGIWILSQFYSGITAVGGDAGGTAYFAHIGGFVAGLVLARLFIRRTALRRRGTMVADRAHGRYGRERDLQH